jgi:hypothetical protein
MIARVAVATPVRTLNVEAPDLEGATVAQLKRLLHALEGLPPNFQRLWRGGVEGEVELSEDDRSLLSVGVRNGTTLRLALNLSGQRPKTALVLSAPVTAVPPTVDTAGSKNFIFFIFNLI